MLAKHIDLVNEQIKFHKEYAERYAYNKGRSAKHLATAARFEALLNDLQKADEALDSESSESASAQERRRLRLSLTPEELEGLPQELLDELSSTDRTEYLILNIIEDHEGIASLDQILVEIYKRTKDIVKRSTLVSRLYRMAQRNLIHGVPGKKGVYSLQPVSREDIDSQLGETSELF